MNGNWQEADTRIIDFPDDEPDTFALYLNHVYTGQLPIANETDEELKKLTAEDFSTFVTKQYDDVLRVFVLGEKLQDLPTKNAMMEAALATTKLRGHDGKRKAPGVQTVNMVYKGTPSSSLARCLLVDIWSALPMSRIFENSNQIHKVMRKDLGKSVTDRYNVVSASIVNITEEKDIAAYQEKPKGA